MQYYANGKYYDTVEAAVNDYVNDTIGSGVSADKFDRIMKAINLDIFENLAKGLTYLKSPVQPLALRTIQRKGHNVPFLESGVLLTEVKDEMLSELHGIVFIGDKRSTIAAYLNYGTGRIPQREFFGLSDEVLSKIDSILEEDG
jgi:hypothetical protein